MGTTTKSTMAQRRSGIAKEHALGFVFVLLIFAIGFAMTAPSLRIPIEILTALLVIIPVGVCATIALVGLAASLTKRKV